MNITLRKAYIPCCPSGLSSCEKGRFGHFKRLTSPCVVWVNTLKFIVLACWFDLTARFYVLLSFIQISIINLYMELGKESLQTRRNKHKPTIFYKSLHDLAPTYLSDLIPTIVGHSNNFALRNADHIQGFRSNSNLFSDSYQSIEQPSK